MIQHPQKMKICINRSFLSKINEKVFDGILHEFSNHDISISQNNDSIVLELCRKDFLYCDKAAPGLEWLKITENEVKDYRIVGDNYIFTLLESWISYGLSRFCSDNKIFDEISILHFDSHQDLMPTFLSHSRGVYCDLITNSNFDFFNPKSVKQAIQSGAITIGSILTPLFHFFSTVKVFHCFNANHTVCKNVKKSFTSRNSLFSMQRASVEFNHSIESSNLYFGSNNISSVIQKASLEKIVFLHIDMDFFNNRYNGTTDWKSSCFRHDPDLNIQKNVIENMVNCLEYFKMTGKICHLSIGLSPSFYPSEFWEPCAEYLLDKLLSVGISANDLYNKLFR